eukprot:s92_g9.t1
MVVAETTVCPLVKACGDFAEFQGSLDLVSSLNESAVLLLAFALGWCVFRPTLHALCVAALEWDDLSRQWPWSKLASTKDVLIVSWYIHRLPSALSGWCSQLQSVHLGCDDWHMFE